MTEQQPIAVLGGGSFGTAIANLLAENGQAVRQWMRDPEQAEAIRTRRENPRYLKGVKVHPGVDPVTDLERTLADCQLIFVALPSSALRKVLRMLITRALAEMTRFAVKLGANPMTFLGLAGVGDLIVTCSSPKSRNYQVGHALGEGLSLEEAVSRMGETAEGVNTLKVLKEKSDEMQVYMPLVAGLHAILFEGRTLAQVIQLLMRGEPKTDVDFIPTTGF